MLLAKEDHPHHPPATWTVRKRGRKWALCVSGDHPSDFFDTKRQAEAAKVSGWLVTLYNNEGIWYAGGTVTGWRPYAQIEAENAALAAKATEADHAAV
jgi:hypothetical protein